MRVAIVYDCLFPVTTGGGERQYRAFAEELVRLGHEVEYLTARQWGDAPPAADFSVVEVCPPLDLYDRDGVRRTSAALRFAFGVLTALLKRRSRYDAVIVSGLPVLNVFAARAALAGSRTRVAVDYLEVWGRRQWVEYAGNLTGNLAWVLQRAAVALTPVATCHSRLSADRLRAERFTGRLLRSPGLIDHVGSPEPRTRAAEPPTVVYAGRHIPDKQVETLPAAVAHARREVPDLRLVILGKGPSSDAVRDAVAREGDPDWITMPGFVTEEELACHMSGAAVLVNPSRREGYGLVVVEAAGFGTPVVLVDDPGNAATELVEPGVNGHVAASTSARDLGEAVVRAVQGGESLRRSSRAWYDDAVRTRTIARTVAAIADELQPR